MNLVLGVDGGGSKTHAAVADDEGRLLGFATNGPSNWETVGLRGAADSLRDAAVKALSPTGKGVRDLKAAAFGLAGVDWPSDVPRVNGVIDQLELGCDHVLENDSMVALRAGTGIATEWCWWPAPARSPRASTGPARRFGRSARA